MTQAEKEAKTKEAVKQVFSDYLANKNCRKTSERYKILDLVYSQPTHFKIEWLYEEMNKQGLRVSRATIYNTMQVLAECNLVLKHQFGKNISVYERAYNNDAHHHLICTVCNSVREYKNAAISASLDNIKIKSFTPAHYSLNIFGVCSKCAKKRK
jgi:Fur family ferric uptake transcriptional regulator